MKFQTQLRLIVCLGFYLIGYVMMTKPVAVVLADPGDLDTTFGADNDEDGDVDGYVLGESGTGANDLILNSSGNIFVAGISGCSSTNNGAIFKFSSAGVLDEAFGDSGVANYDFDSSITSDASYVTAIGLDASENLLVAGSYIKSFLSYDFFVSQFLSADGTESTSFAHTAAMYDGSKSDQALGGVVDSNGQMISVGYTINASGYDDILIAKFGATDGVPDSVGFDTDGVYTTSLDTTTGTGFEYLSGVALKYDDTGDYDIIASGAVGVVADGSVDLALVYLNSDGSVNEDFDGGDGYLTKNFSGGNDYGGEVAVDASGNIFVSGYTTNADGDQDAFVGKYLTSTGGWDSNFGTDGFAYFDPDSGNAQANAMVLDSQGGIVIAGKMQGSVNEVFYVARFTSEGDLDTTFGTASGDQKLGYVSLSLDSTAREQKFKALALDASENIIVVGTLTEPDMIGKAILAKFEGGYATTETVAVCGNATVETGEDCDPGTDVEGDTCSVTCTTVAAAATCGDGTTDTDEECDDQNLTDGDGCSSTCTTEVDADGDGYYGSLDCDDSDKEVHENCVDPSESPTSGGGCGCVISKRNPNTFEAGLYGAAIVGLVLVRLRKRVKPVCTTC